MSKKHLGRFQAQGGGIEKSESWDKMNQFPKLMV